MATYNVTVEDRQGNKRRITFEGDQPPSPADIDEAFASMSAPASMGELRRREGMGEIDATPPERKPSGFLDTVLTAIGQGPVMGTPATFTPAMTSRFPMGSPEQQAEEQGRMEGLREGAAMGVSMLTPASTAGNLLGRAAITGARSGAAYGATKGALDVAAGDASVGEAAIDTALSTVTGAVAGPIVETAVRGGQLAGTALLQGGRRAAADLFRPIRLSQEQLQAIRSRELVETATGQRIPLGIADVLNTKTIARQIAGETGDLTPEALSVIEQAAIHSAANTANEARSIEEVSRKVFDILDAQKQGISKQAEEAALRFTRQAVAAVNKADEQIVGQARSVFSGRSDAQLGNELKRVSDEAFDSAQSKWNEAYTAAREDPAYAQAKPKLGAVADKARELGIMFVKQSDGSLSPMGAPPGARSSIGQARDLVPSEEQQIAKSIFVDARGNPIPLTGAEDEAAGQVTLEQARQLATNISKTVKNANYLPGVDTRVKLDLLSEVKRAIDDAVDPFPTLKEKLSGANKLYSENIDRFKGAFAKGVLSEVGTEGGATGEAILRKLQGADAETNLAQLESLLGSGATAGQDFSRQGLNLIREAVLSKAGRTGTDVTGRIDVGKMAGVVDSLPKPVRDKLFPDFDRIQQLAIREAAKQTGAKSASSAKAFVDQLELDPAVVQKAFEGDTAALEKAAKEAIAAEVKAQQELSRLSLDELSERTAFDLKKWVTNPRNQDRLANTMAQLERRNPELVQSTRNLFMQDLLEKSSPGGIFNPDAFNKVINETALPTGPGAPGVPRGDYTDALETLFGKDQAAKISDIGRTLKGIRRVQDLPKDERRGLFEYVVFGYTGGPIASTSPATLMSALGRVGSAASSIRYRIAANLLTDDNLRRAAMEPLSDSTLAALDTAVRGAAVGIAREFGKRSPQNAEIQDIYNSIQPGSTRYVPPMMPAMDTPAPAPRQQTMPENVEIEVPNRAGRLVPQLMAREEAIRLLNEQRAIMSNVLQQLNQ